MQTATHKFDVRVKAIHTLRVNAKSLAAEARFIRSEERRCGPEYRIGLYLHRILDVRQEARITQLALAMVRGRKYRHVERSAFTPPSIPRLVAKLQKHVGAKGFDKEAVVKWLSVTEQ